MSLDYNYGNILNEQELHGPYDKISDNTEEQQVAYEKTRYLCFELMAIGVSKVTKANADRVWQRIEALQNLRGPILNWGGEPLPYTREDIHRRIGYYCNVADRDERWFQKVLRDYQH